MRELRRILMGPGGRAANLRTPGDTDKGVQVEEVRLSESGDDIEILFRDLGRSECRFGFREPAVESEGLRADGTPRNYHTVRDAAISHADLVWVLFEEEIYAMGYGLPKHCSSEVVNWL